MKCRILKIDGDAVQLEFPGSIGSGDSTVTIPIDELPINDYDKTRLAELGKEGGHGVENVLQTHELRVVFNYAVFSMRRIE